MLMRWSLLFAPVFAVQIPLHANFDSSTSLSFSSSSEHVHVQHKHYPDHQLRIRQPKLCDSVKQWSGYLDTPHSKHFYFHLFESRNDPVADPVALWLNGGPGCSSFTGMLMEMGPCSVTREAKDAPLTLKYNPYSWNSNATLIFLDQPVGVGYSYADKNVSVGTTEEAAVDVHAFLTILFEAFNRKMGSSDFHMAGESFAGRYIRQLLLFFRIVK